MKVLYWVVFLLSHLFFVCAYDKPNINTLPQGEAFTIQLTKGIMAFEIDVGAHGTTRQKIMVNLTSSFDGLALPSHAVSALVGTYYQPAASQSKVDQTNNSQ